MDHHEPSPPRDISGKVFLARTAKHHTHGRTRRTSNHAVGQVSCGRALKCHPDSIVGKSQVMPAGTKPCWDSADQGSRSEQAQGITS